MKDCPEEAQKTGFESSVDTQAKEFAQLAGGAKFLFESRLRHRESPPKAIGKSAGGEREATWSKASGKGRPPKTPAGEIAL